MQDNIHACTNHYSITSADLRATYILIVQDFQHSTGCEADKKRGAVLLVVAYFRQYQKYLSKI
ncbi:MAG: hypothetical protein K8L97_33430 [Anaerolineae bacterium]|nr:hypothetical protein [Anaerolineae bacterium]